MVQKFFILANLLYFLSYFSDSCYENVLSGPEAVGRLWEHVETPQRLQEPTTVAPATARQQWRPYAARIPAMQPAGRFWGC